MCPWCPSWQIFEQGMKVAAGFVAAFKLEPKKQSAIMQTTHSLIVCIREYPSHETPARNRISQGNGCARVAWLLDPSKAEVECQCQCQSSSQETRRVSLHQSRPSATPAPSITLPLCLCLCLCLCLSPIASVDVQKKPRPRHVTRLPEAD